MRWAIGLVVAGCGFGGASGDGVVADAAPGFDATPGTDGMLPPDGAIDAADASMLDAAVDATPDAGLTSLDTVCTNAGYTQRGLAYYRVVEQGLAWEAAELDCEDDLATSSSTFGSTHLVVARTSDESALIQSLGAGDVWVGYTDRRDEVNFRWVTDELGVFGPQVDGNNDGKDCVQLRTGGYQARDCTESESFVCECDLSAVNRDNY